MLCLAEVHCTCYSCMKSSALTSERRWTHHGFPMGYVICSGRRVRTEQGEGGFSIIRYGAGPNGPMRTLSQYMIGSGATFGYVESLQHRSIRRSSSHLMHDRFFMSIGSIIRTEGMSPATTEAYMRARRQPMILPRRYMRRPEDRQER